MKIVAPPLLLDTDRELFDRVETEEEEQKVKGYLKRVHLKPFLKKVGKHRTEFQEVQVEERKELLTFLLHLDRRVQLNDSLRQHLRATDQQHKHLTDLPERGTSIEQLL